VSGGAGGHDVSEQDYRSKDEKIAARAFGNRPSASTAPPKSDIDAKPRTKGRPKTERPRLHKVILVNDDFTPREFVVTVLKGDFVGAKINPISVTKPSRPERPRIQNPSSGYGGLRGGLRGQDTQCNNYPLHTQIDWRHL
jgi:hypothetical protein